MDADKGDETQFADDAERRGRKRKGPNSRDIFQQLPESAIDGLPPERVEELQFAYEILQTIMTISRIEPFLVRPDSSLFGLATYYNVIKTPMWLTEISRRLLEREYSSISQFVADIRLMLENCYRFWGPAHKFTKKGLRIEQKLEQRIDVLPDPIKKKCLDGETTCDEIEFDTGTVEDYCHEENSQEPDTWENSLQTLKGFQSKILDKVLESEEAGAEENNQDQKMKESEMLQWEKETLVTDEIKEEINATWQLAEIGHFLKISYEVLNVEEITQYEVERMLLMPMESTTLATLMTSMLSPAAARSSLDVTPVMPYEVWTKRLGKRVEDWFSTYYKKCDAIQTYQINGVEPHFWEVMGLMNPLESKCFHEIDFFQRVWILKSLCNHLLHTNKCIQDLFLDDPSLDLRETKLGSDKEGYEYFTLPFLPEIRVYKQRLVSKCVNWGMFAYSENLRSKLLAISVKFVWDKEDSFMKLKPNSKDFYIAADDMESLTNLLESVKKDNVELSKQISRFLKTAKKYKRSLEGLEIMYTQWQGYQKRPADGESNSMSMWEVNTEPDKSNEPEAPEVLGKRRSKMTVSYANMIGESDLFDSFNEESSDGSDWESTLKKKKKGSNRKQSRQEESPVEPNQKSPVTEKKESIIKPTSPPKINETNQNVHVKEELTLDYDDVKPIVNPLTTFNPPDLCAQEPMDIKPVVPVISTNQPSNVIEQLVPYVKPSSQPTQNVSSVIKTNIVKAEIEDDVISISSDEEKETKPDIKLLNRNNSPSNSNLAQPVYKSPVLNSALSLDNRIISNSLPLMQPNVSPIITTLGSPPINTSLNPSLRPTLSPNLMGGRQTSPVVQNWPQSVRMANMINNYMVQSPSNINFNMMQQNLRGSPVSPRVNAASPRSVPPLQPSPRVRGQYTPRQRSPLTFGANSPMGPAGMTPRNITPTRGQSPRAPTARQNVARSLFSTTPPKPKVPTIEGLLEVGLKPDGSYGYHVRLPDGGIIQMSRTEIEDIRKKNNGRLPQKVEVPLIKKPGQPLL